MIWYQTAILLLLIKNVVRGRINIAPVILIYFKQKTYYWTARVVACGGALHFAIDFQSKLQSKLTKRKLWQINESLLASIRS